MGGVPVTSTLDPFFSLSWFNPVGEIGSPLEPHTMTYVPGLLLAGGHCRTSVNLYSMEAACESGLRAANVITQTPYTVQRENIFSSDSLALYIMAFVALSFLVSRF